MAALERVDDPDLSAIRGHLEAAIDQTAKATAWMVETGPRDIQLAASGAVPYLNLFAYTVGGWLMAKSALAAGKRLAEANGDAQFYETKIKSARFFADQNLVRASALAATVIDGGTTVMAVAEDMF